VLNEIPGLYKLNDHISEEAWDPQKTQVVLDSTIKPTQIIGWCLKAWECNQFQRVKIVKAIKEFFCIFVMNRVLGNKTLILNSTTACKLISVFQISSKKNKRNRLEICVT
jgi:hypothetical protein